MSDQPTPPPKPKPGSLRDRIAAFEKPAAGVAPGPAPVPRPKPGGLSWKPKVPSPPSSPSGADSASTEKKVGGGMSASDAKESIGKGGSLKERMAALQNRGGFGAPPPVAPKPALEKPKWKPPPVIAPVEMDEDDVAPRGESSKSPPPVSVKSTEDETVEDGAQDEASPGVEGEGQAEEDPEEEERQRRAAIAARMARLGGARVGMAPVFGGKPAPKKSEPSTELSETATEDIKSPKEITPESTTDSTSILGAGDSVRKDSESASLLSVDSETQQSRSPNSMPLPSAPRRAAPPRKKGVKSPEQPTAPVLEEKLVTSPDAVPNLDPLDVSDAPAVVAENDKKAEAGDVEEEVGQVDKEAGVEAPSADEVKLLALDDSHQQIAADDDEKDFDKHIKVQESSDIAPSTHGVDVPADVGTEDEEIEDEGYLQPRSIDDAPIKAEPIAQAVEEPEENEEAEEAARRKRVAEKLAKMGGVNPLAPPQRKPSGSADDIPTSPTVSPTLAKRASLSHDGVSSPPPRRQSTRKSSGDSIPATQDSASQTRETPARKSSVEPVFSSEAATDSVSKRNSEDDSQHDIRGVALAAGIPEEPEQSSDVEASDEETERKQNKDNHLESPKAKTESDLSLSNEFSEDPDDFETEAPSAIVAPAPPVNVATRPASVLAAPVDPALPTDPVSFPRPPAAEAPVPIVSPPARSLPPPPQLIFQPSDAYEEASDSEAEQIRPSTTRSPLSSQELSGDDDDEPLRRLPPRSMPSDEIIEYEAAPLPVPNRRSLQYENNPAISMPSARPIRSIPPPPPISAPVSDVEQDSENDEVLPIPPRRRPMTPGTPPSNDVPLIVPPPGVDDSAKKAEPSPLRQTSYPAEKQTSTVLTPTSSGDASPSHLSPARSVSDQEILDDEEGDPIDPSFHSPSRRTSTITLPSATSTAPVVPEPAAEPEEDEQQARRRTIAERMAKLGGIKFGAAPLPASMRALPRTEEDVVPSISTPDEEFVDPNEEEEERARKERIAAKLAGMGGMRIGMMPLGVGTLRQQSSHVLTEQAPPTPPSRSTPPSRPPPPSHSQDSDAEPESNLSASQQSLSASEDGVKVEAEESEIEEVSYEDAQPEEVPPPIPNRSSRRRGTGSESEVPQSPTTPVGRPPVPTSLPTRKSSVQTTGSTPRKSSSESSYSVRRTSTHKQQSEYVMVEEPRGYTDDAPPPLPQARPPSRPPPPRGGPPPPPPPASGPSDSIASQWELPSIPSSSLNFGESADLSLSWTEEPHPAPTSPPPPPPPEKQPARRQSALPPPADRQLSPDDLIAVWGRVGVQICEAATTLFDKSKKALVGDGTFDGFVQAVLSEVPNAALPSPGSYGYVVYAQSGGSVQKRSSDIMPGDIVLLQDAKLKGHKGIHTYNQTVGVGEPLVGVISEFEPKKSKIRVFQANQHVGQQTVEAVSYRLEDLKSGVVKVYRVLDN